VPVRLDTIEDDLRDLRLIASDQSAADAWPTQANRGG
jgi:hypothetical protein